jgi:hypothetical protein
MHLWTEETLSPTSQSFEGQIPRLLEHFLGFCRAARNFELLDFGP